ncbi:MAG: ShlB/FhaC/HecB family hemolysin secretion/activation protein [Rhodoferax sp.]|nr:ShlB/FhaC/HecB family hemolysin secretion/activation protein [Rhodoferax sp.]
MQRALNRMRRPRARSVVVLAVLALAIGNREAANSWVAQAWAQVAPPPTAGAILDGLEIRRPVLPGSPPEVVFNSGQTPNTQDRNGRKFLVKGFQFVGNAALTQGQLRQAVERFTESELNLFELKKAADAVTALYRNQGYPLAVAIVPAQKVEDGLVIIEVIEGRIGILAFDGNDRYSTSFLRSYTKPAVNAPVVTMETLERALLTLNDLPGLTATATLSPGQNRGDTDVVVKVKESPFRATLSANNNGRTEAGAIRVDATVGWANPLGMGDELVFRKMQAEKLLMDYTQLKYSVPIGTSGARVALSQSNAKYTVAGDFEALQIGGEVTTTELSATYPVVRSRSRNLVASIGVRDTQTRQSALATPLAENSMQLLSIGGSGNWVHKDSSSTSASAVYSTNFRDNTANEPGAVLSKLDLDVTHLTGVARKWDFYLRGNGVASGSSLPDSEKFSIGGPDSVRGFRAGEMRGDRGYMLSAELRRQFMVGRKVGVFSVFHDFGTVTNLGFATQDILTSAGMGVAVYPTQKSQVKVDIAWPLRNNLATDPGPQPRVWASASISF